MRCGIRGSILTLDTRMIAHSRYKAALRSHRPPGEYWPGNEPVRNAKASKPPQILVGGLQPTNANN
jgi:hypothetical protein